MNNPPEWLWPEEVEDLPNPATDKRELWEMVATCTPGALISAHYSSLTLRVVADWLQHRVEQAGVNGWNYESDRMINDLRIAAMAADLAIESAGPIGGPEYMPRKLNYPTPTTELSPAASAVWKAFNQDEAGEFLDHGDKLCKALRTIADVALPRNAHGMVNRQELRAYILSIANELGGD